MGSTPAGASPPSGFHAPEGLEHVFDVKKKGKRAKYYTNVQEQKFHDEPDLKQNINYSEEKGLSTYAPKFQPPILGTFPKGQRSNIKLAVPSHNNKNHASGNNGEHGSFNSEINDGTSLKMRRELHNYSERECAGALIDLCVQSINEVEGAWTLIKMSAQRNFDCRCSRRLAGLEPELQNDFEFNRAFEYIIKDRPRR